jgi:hypothetical protein
MAPTPENPTFRLAAAGSVADPKPPFESCRTGRPAGPETKRIDFPTVDGVRVRYAESDGPPARTIVLTSPWPESLYAFARIWPSLAQRFRLFAVDLHGFGGAEGRADLLSPEKMGCP